MVSYISSKENKTAKLIRQLKKKSIREKTGQFVAEGRKIVLEALKYVPQNVICIVVSDEFCEKEADILAQLSNFCGNVYRNRSYGLIRIEYALVDKISVAGLKVNITVILDLKVI